MADKASTFASRLQSLRSAQGLTAAKVAERLGVATSTYRDWEYGRAIRGEPYLKLAEIFQVSVYELLSGEAPKTAYCRHQLELIQRHLQVLKNELARLG